MARNNPMSRAELRKHLETDKPTLGAMPLSPGGGGVPKLIRDLAVGTGAALGADKLEQKLTGKSRFFGKRKSK